jgi:long-subunit acyl-CoA synthetase (AMP-forming)
VPPEADDLATLAYDMSTQGKIKGVMLSHRNLLSSSRALVYQARPPPPRSTVLSTHSH